MSKKSKGFGKEVRKIGGLEKHIKEKSKSKRQSVEWYRREVLEYLYENITDTVIPNKLYFFEYDPKLKDKLKIYDTYPLVYSFDMSKDNFLGSNLHYLKPKLRPAYALSLINKTARIYENTIHRYIFKQADNLFFEVKEEDWEFIASLPLEHFIEN
jgi:hypothetical protein